MLDIKKIRGCWLEVNLDNISHNLKMIKDHINNEKVIINVVLKANGNGHGAIKVAHTAIENGITAFSVAILDEAIELRQAGIYQSILILGITAGERVDEIVKYGVEQTVDNYYNAKLISDAATAAGKTVKIHIKVDTGLNRLGFRPVEESLEEILKIFSLGGIEIKGIFTHLAVSDITDKTFTEQQFKKFNFFTDLLNKAGIHIQIKHVANSAAIVDHGYTYLDMVRTGTLLYGFYPSNEVSKIMNFKEAASFKARIVHIHEIGPGDTVSYGRTFKADKITKIAVIPVGYADGYMRELSGKARVLCNGKRIRVIGRICMDQTMIDITNAGEVHINDEVVLYGQQGNEKISFDDVANLVGTINIDVSSRISRRVPRVYIKNGKICDIVNYLYKLD